jgi:hypothetical protein
MHATSVSKSARSSKQRKSLPKSLGSIDASAGPTLEGFAQVVGRRANGPNFIISACVPIDSAQRIADEFNRTADDGTQATVHEIELPNFASPNVAPVSVLIVPKPADWKPPTPLDLPPEFERHVEHDRLSAAAFAYGFNKAEMRDAMGFWAIGPTNAVGEQSIDIGAAQGGAK